MCIYVYTVWSGSGGASAAVAAPTCMTRYLFPCCAGVCTHARTRQKICLK